MTFVQLKTIVQCLADKVRELEENGGGGSGSGATQITGPVVTSLDDARGSVGDWSYDPDATAGPTYYFKVSTSPHTWIAMAAATEIP